jgi:bifunctional DNA-binding transcriptional regulator/antitoxin component of YhaV-PrlF toxin-antitoxin module
MGRNKDENIRKLTKVGNKSYGITLPINVIREFGWRERQKLQLKIRKKKKEIIIKDWEK